MEIIGVIKDIKYTNLRDEIPIQMFGPYLADQDVESRQPRRILPDVSSVRVAPSLGADNSAPDQPYLLFVREGTLMGMAFDLKTLNTVGDVLACVTAVVRRGDSGQSL